MWLKQVAQPFSQHNSLITQEAPQQISDLSRELANYHRNHRYKDSIYHFYPTLSSPSTTFNLYRVRRKKDKKQNTKTKNKGKLKLKWKTN